MEPEPERTGGDADRTSWSDVLSRDALRLIAEGVREMAGFQVALISVVLGEDFRSVAIAGSEEARAALWDAVTPVRTIQQELAKAEDWGRFKYVPSDRVGAIDEWGWVPDYEPSDHPDAWHPLDLLLAPLRDDEGRLVGLLSIDLPTSGRRPDAQQRSLLEKYAAQAERALLVALERHEFSEQIRLATTAREIVRSLSVQLPIEDLLVQAGSALSEGFRAGGSWVQTFAGDVLGSGALYSARGADIVLPDGLVEVAETAAHQLWSVQQWVVIERDRRVEVLTDGQSRQIHAFMERIEADSLLFVPIGAGSTCVGNLVLTRVEGQAPWGRTEAEAALDIGHDLGRSILNARTFAREHRLVQELTALDQYKGRLIATVAHELKNPLTAIMGHLEMLESTPDLTSLTRSSLAAIDRGSQRLQRVIDDLLLLSKVGDPETAIIPAPVALQPVLEDLAELNAVAAQRAGVAIRLEMPEAEVLALGDAEELDTALGNVLSNAVKYGRSGSDVTVELAREDDEVVVTVRDQGIGISPEDRAQLFTEFFRSSNPQAVAQPGTGLGLAIVQRIVQRHGGAITVDSELGVGSAFTLRLPAAVSG
ncbi:HAMP domain-containing sensor histidine kinase [Nocardioides sp. 503]|uniref:sensor histidine kinase n=1 Tax=Nocardioides sp. 503 TaxID=2508326 RepID=UPI00106F838C|nr:HAMP domain-containing sensor histidine kinase [Nocardioides sp. 503]